MISFKQFLREMPQRTNAVAKTHFTDYDYEPITHSGPDYDTGEDHQKISTCSQRHNYWRTRFRDDTDDDEAHLYNSIRVTNKEGTPKYNIEGYGNHKKKTFRVTNVSSNQSRSVPYHHVIHHLVSGGHIDQWTSDTHLSPGSENTYDELAKKKDLKVVHRGEGGKATKVLPGTAKDFMGKKGRFIVTKEESK